MTPSPDPTNPASEGEEMSPITKKALSLCAYHCAWATNTGGHCSECSADKESDWLIEAGDMILAQLRSDLTAAREERDELADMLVDARRQRDAAESEASQLRSDLTADQEERDEVRRENDYLRASLANGSGPCAYCKLPKEEWSKCADGFPGCARGDDAMLCPHVGGELAANAEIATLRETVAKLKESQDFLQEVYEATIARWRDAALLAVGGDLRKVQRLLDASSQRIVGSALREISDEEKSARAAALADAQRREKEARAALSSSETGDRT